MGLETGEVGLEMPLAGLRGLASHVATDSVDASASLTPPAFCSFSPHLTHV